MKTVLALFLLTCVVPSHSLQAIDVSRENPEDPTTYTFERRLVFHAVLEGLYEDGVSGEALEQLIPDPDSMWIDGEPEKTNFVFTCPICMPTFDALQLYHSRKPFFGQKLTVYNTFGPGLSDEWLGRLKGDPNVRREAIQELVQTWVNRRLDRMKLTAAERAAIEINLTEMKKDGEMRLKNFQDRSNGDSFAVLYEGWKKCAACEGASSFMTAQ